MTSLKKSLIIYERSVWIKVDEIVKATNSMFVLIFFQALNEKYSLIENTMSRVEVRWKSSSFIQTQRKPRNMKLKHDILISLARVNISKEKYIFSSNSCVFRTNDAC